MAQSVVGLPRLAGRLTAELILSSPQEMNAINEYQIDLRGGCARPKAPGRSGGPWGVGRSGRTNPACVDHHLSAVHADGHAPTLLVSVVRTRQICDHLGCTAFPRIPESVVWGRVGRSPWMGLTGAQGRGLQGAQTLHDEQASAGVANAFERAAQATRLARHCESPVFFVTDLAICALGIVARTIRC